PISIRRVRNNAPDLRKIRRESLFVFGSDADGNVSRITLKSPRVGMEACIRDAFDSEARTEEGRGIPSGKYTIVISVSLNGGDKVQLRPKRIEIGHFFP